jgi:hypothetical protein
VALPPLLICFRFTVRVDDFTNVAKYHRSGWWPGRYGDLSSDCRDPCSDVYSDFPVPVVAFICVLAHGHRRLLNAGVQETLMYGHTLIICGGTDSSEYLDSRCLYEVHREDAKVSGTVQAHLPTSLIKIISSAPTRTIDFFLWCVRSFSVVSNSVELVDALGWFTLVIWWKQNIGVIMSFALPLTVFGLAVHSTKSG